MRICFVAEHVSEPFDEGYKKTVGSLIRELGARHDVCVIGRDLAQSLGITVSCNRLYLSPRVVRPLRQFRPELLIYFPHSSATLGGFVRARVLKTAAACRTAMVCVQPRRHSSLSLRIIAALKPDRLIVQSRETADLLGSAGMSAIVVPSGVDVERFRPVERAQVPELRRKYGLPVAKRIILHVGHLNAGRGIGVLGNLTSADMQAVVVASTTTARDEELRASLIKRGVIVLDDYYPHIEELFQAADVYVFPVTRETSAIAFPLTVLEALSCGVPVLASPFGALEAHLPQSPWIRYFREPSELLPALSALFAVTAAQRAQAREYVTTRFSWPAIGRALLEAAN